MMRPVIKHKVDAIKKMAKHADLAGYRSAKPPRASGDNLSKAIRDEREAAIFQEELKLAFKQSKSR